VQSDLYVQRSTGLAKHRLFELVALTLNLERDILSLQSTVIDNGDSIAVCPVVLRGLPRRELDKRHPTVSVGVDYMDPIGCRRTGNGRNGEEQKSRNVPQ
jgi:hypothetical protein